ncbi:MAG: hypothetical protein C0506_14255 [Anaerolinea sp.]|nr:hypothetical protein [Anaerolinea sp.]
MAVLAAVRLASDSGGQTAAGQPASDAKVSSGANGELSQLRTPDFHSMAVSPANPRVLLYGHHGGVLRSTDGGRTWTRTNLGGETDDAMGMGFAGSGGDTVFAAGHDTFFRSEDGGQTWKRIKPGLPGTDVHGLATAPDDAAVVYANVTTHGLYRSGDGGNAWTRTSQSLPGDVMALSAGPNGRVYAASMSQGVLRSDDNGKTFKATGGPSAGGSTAALTVAASPSDANVLYAGTQDALLRSTDGGASWQRKSVPGGGQVMVVAVSPAAPEDVTVVAIQSDRAGHVFRSVDGGATWGDQ